MMVREPKSVVVTPQDLWFIQSKLPFHAFMMDPRTNTPIFPNTLRRYGNGETVAVHTAWKIRDKANRLLLRMADEHTSEGLLHLDYDECWFLDMILEEGSYQGNVQDEAGLSGSKRLLIGVFRCIYEHENMLNLAEGIQGSEVDQPFKFDMLREYLAQAEDKSWGRRERGPQDPGEGVR